MKRFLTLIASFLLLAGCNSKPKVIGADSGKQKKKDFDSLEVKSKVIITGKSDDPQALDFISITDGTYYFGRNEGDSKKILGDSILLVLNNIRPHQYSEFAAVSKTHYYQTRLYLTPGDSMHFDIKNGELRFSGSHAKTNNFFIELEKNTPLYRRISYMSNLYSYKEKVDSIYKEKLRFLSRYVQQQNITSKVVLNLFKDNLKQEYLFELMNPRTKLSYLPNKQINYLREIDGIQYLIAKEFAPKETFFSFKKYLNNISLEDINRPDLMYDRHFRENVTQYIRNFFEDTETSDYTKAKFLAEKRFIENNLDKDLIEFAMTNLIYDYYIKGFGYGKENSKFLIQMIEKYESGMDARDKKYYDAIRKDLESRDFTLSKLALETKMVNIQGDTTTLKEIFSRSDQRIKVVDFWASWCPPCVMQIKQNKDFKDRLSVENNVEWIYLSIDEDKDHWMRRSRELKSLNFYNSYWLIDGIHSSLAKFLKVKTIPRYILFDKTNKVYLNNAPIPNKLGSFETVIDHIQ